MKAGRAFDQKLKAGLAAVAAVLLAVVALAYANSHQFRVAGEEVSQVQGTLLNLDRLLLTMLDAETGMRGYVISGREDYLEPYNRALSTIEAQLAQLQRQMHALELDAEFTELNSQAQAQLTFRRGLVERLRAASDKAAARANVRLDEGKAGMDQIRRIVTQVHASQEQALARRNELSRAADKRFFFAIIALGVVVFAMMIGGLFLVRHHLRQLRRLELERDNFFNLSNDMYCIAGMDGVFRQVNPAATRILGYSSEELTDKPFLEFVHPDDREATVAESKKLATGERTVYFENRYRTKAGAYRWMLWSAEPSPDGKLIYAVARDITDHKASEERMAQLVEETRRRAGELEAVNQELEAFSYSVSHDLRAPLRHIAGFADMLQKHTDGKLDDKARRFIKTIMDSAKRMGMLIDDLLIFSRMGRAEMRREKVDLNAMIDGILTDLKPDIGNRNIVWKREPLPEVTADKAMLRQVLVNLIANAVKYSGPRDPAEIAIAAREENGEQIFEVRDNGVGFDMAYAHKLFGVFQRLHEGSQFEGTGIGLANVRRIITRHGGRVWAEAELDKGATFHFSLPKA